MTAQLNGILATVLLVMLASIARGDDPSKMQLKSEHFDKDPGWEAHNNRIAPKNPRRIKQNFGYSATNFAGEKPGEIGGRVERGSVGMSFVEKIAPLTLNDLISASGTFALKSIDGGNGGFLFGFLNSQQLPGEGDCSSLAMLMIFERSG